jgi:hypothetical protein
MIIEISSDALQDLLINRSLKVLGLILFLA